MTAPITRYHPASEAWAARDAWIVGPDLGRVKTRRFAVPRSRVAGDLWEREAERHEQLIAVGGA